MIKLNATLIVQVVNFLLLMWILNHLLFKPILRALEKREEKVNHLLKETGDLLSQAQGVKEEYEMRIKQAQTQALEVKEKIERESREEGERLLKKAFVKAEKGLAETSVAIAKDAEGAKREFERLSREISLEIYQKILGVR
jgi:F-type H+-transporting ATPase subunit b